MIGTIVSNLYGITLVLNVGTDLGSLDGCFDGSNASKMEVLLLGDALRSTDSKGILSDKGITLG